MSISIQPSPISETPSLRKNNHSIPAQPQSFHLDSQYIGPNVTYLSSLLVASNSPSSPLCAPKVPKVSPATLFPLLTDSHWGQASPSLFAPLPCPFWVQGRGSQNMGAANSGGSAEEAGGVNAPHSPSTLTSVLCLSLCPLCRPAPGYFCQDCGELGSGGGAWRRTISCRETPPSLGPGAGRTPYLSTLSGQPAVGLGGTSAMACPHPHSGPQPESACPPACSSRFPR
jgi:hypothetical protein